jgi:hypothetical protein
MDSSISREIMDGYHSDGFCEKIMEPSFSMKGFSSANGLWYIGDQLLIPCIGNICEELFHLAHDTSGHFSVDKSYAMLCDAYYWPNMSHNLETTKGANE